MSRHFIHFFKKILDFFIFDTQNYDLEIYYTLLFSIIKFLIIKKSNIGSDYLFSKLFTYIAT